MASFTTANMLKTLYNRLMDPSKDQFDPNGNDDLLYLELNNAQEEIINRLLPHFMTAIEVIEERLILDDNGEFVIGDLSKVPIDGVNSIQKILTYHRNISTLVKTIVPTVSLSEDELNKIYNNAYFTGSSSEPKFLVQGNTVKVFSGVVVSIVTATPVSGPPNYVIVNAAELTGSGGPIDHTINDYASGYFLRSSKGNDYPISNYDSGTRKFTLPEIESEDGSETNWQILTPYKDNYCGSVLVSYQRQPLEMASGVDCELQNKYRSIILLLAESSIWASDGKAENSDRAYQKAMNQINMINGTIKPTDNIGYRANKY